MRIKRYDTHASVGGAFAEREGREEGWVGVGAGGRERKRERNERYTTTHARTHTHTKKMGGVGG
jgi:hypothetical protein